MDKESVVKRVEKDFEFLKGKVLALLIFGSFARGEATARSDIDICVVAPKQKPVEVLKAIWRKVDVYGKKYDVWVFEELPLYLKIEIIENHEIVFGDAGELGEYFYFWRKLWEDQKHRQKMSREELLKLLE